MAPSVSACCGSCCNEPIAWRHELRRSSVSFFRPGTRGSHRRWRDDCPWIFHGDFSGKKKQRESVRMLIFPSKTKEKAYGDLPVKLPLTFDHHFESGNPLLGCTPALLAREPPVPCLQNAELQTLSSNTRAKSRPCAPWMAWMAWILGLPSWRPPIDLMSIFGTTWPILGTLTKQRFGYEMYLHHKNNELPSLALQAIC